ALDPDIICFQEIFDHTSAETASLLDEWIPLPDNALWQHAQQGPDNIVVSKHPILESQNIGSNGAFKIEVGFSRVIVINAHLPCCENDEGRQFEVDQILDYIKDARGGQATVSIENNSPIIICGDMNMVGEAQQRNSLINGDIINEDIFGEDITPDWNGQNLRDAIPNTTGTPFSFTWANLNSSFSKGRLDYIIYTGSNLQKQNAFNLYTPTLGSEELIINGLNINDVPFASDHIPVVADFRIGDFTSIANEEEANVLIFPNPTYGLLQFKSEIPVKRMSLYNSIGSRIFQTHFIRNQIDISALSVGHYIMELELNNGQRIFENVFKLD
ncbi:MAG: endonuclease/exonuclease/phosphatase family protein, partial [Bacteroidota bacterium]